ncbi:PREDICTED: LOW QUALITY PROTEIN: probably inactive receptor-like protein kinase At2g46850 [Ipomoea nil]|uniref:LOW QUALITY PROTEIN: probably inactive receptor-like protein kinase At2g46850 n=1 Tax=Ipomoea nil TaxID=35883 RepID=UPI0009016D87|nr:PREDICTED: LOW QUALITY PROTEIN: probably inactive receptor-like protein kinase At2g46850 [Ipomoea nil]
MSPSSHCIPLLVLLLALSLTTAVSPVAAAQQADELLRRCDDTCGGVQIPYPFYVSPSAKCGPPPSEAFRLSCNGSVNSSSSHIFFRSYRVLRFFPDGLLLDFPNSSSVCRRYADLASFGFAGNNDGYFGVSTDNVFDLYGCEDSSVCRGDCGGSLIPAAACAGTAGGRPGCCFPLSDRAGWTGFSMFAQLGCRGFSSWVVSPDSKGGSERERGIKVEWAIPSNSSEQICALNAKIIAASSVISGVRCHCEDGFAGDGFTSGVGCLKSCFKEGKEVYGQDCYAKSHRPIKTKILVGVVTSTLTIASLTALFCLLRRPAMKDADRFDPEHIHQTQTNISFQDAYTTHQLFNYSELEEATGGFADAHILCHGNKAKLYAGTLVNASPIAVHKIQCDGQRDLLQTLSATERVSAVLHRNLARPLGCSVGSGHTLLVVYGGSANGTLMDHLRHGQSGALEWCDRLGIVAETASVLAFLQCEICPPIFHHNLQSGYIFLDGDWSAHVSGFELVSDLDSQADEDDEKKQAMSDVYDLGLLLLEIIMGADEHQLSDDHRHQHAKLALQKIRSGKIEEIVDAHLNYHDQTPSKQEEIDIVADLATRCLLFSGDGKIHMADVARELLHLTNKDASRRKRGHSTSALEETFSNSSLLQMISMSPDSIFIPSAARGFS